MTLISSLPDGYENVVCDRCEIMMDDPDNNAFWHCYECSKDVHIVCKRPCLNDDCDCEMECI